MLLNAVLLGAANTVYHPSDYSILGSVIEPSRLGRAYSWHTFSGYLGGALAPMVMLTLTVSGAYKRLSRLACWPG
jgi:FSR family fosmidomycin resistance protein-like MFS transporter